MDIVCRPSPQKVGYLQSTVKEYFSLVTAHYHYSLVTTATVTKSGTSRRKGRGSLALQHGTVIKCVTQLCTFNQPPG
jgi:hypothetical protein